MSLPDNFSPWEHLQTVLMQVHNRRVRAEFSDLGGDDWVSDVTTPRGSLRTACTIKDDDSAVMAFNRMMLFYIMLRHASDIHPALYTIPSDRYQQEVRFAPQITLYFREDIEDVEVGYSPIDSEISFRVIGEDSNSFTEADARQFAIKIKSEFSASNGYRWHKGRLKVCYRRKDQGYQLSINAYSESEARQVIGKVLSLQNHTISEEYLSIHQLGQNPPTVPPSEFIYGQSRRTPRKRPVGFVRFQWAELHIWGIPNAITLTDRSYRRRNPLVI